MPAKIKIERVSVRSCTVPTEVEETDGTLAWNSTTMVIVEAEGGGQAGLGYSYTQKSVARLVNDKLASLVTGLPAMDLPALRIERLFFDGLPEVKGGEMQPDLERPGLGLVLKERDAEKYADSS